MQLVVTPSRALRLSAAEPSELEARRARAVEAAFERGAGFGLLHLAGPELHRELPADLAFGRELGRRFMASLCRAGAVVGEPPPELSALASAAPPMRGAEYLDDAALADAWAAMRDAAAAELAEHAGVLEYAASKNPSWHVVGRVVLHLAENRGDRDAPFAFLATYVDGVGPAGQPRHRPLARALEAARGDRDALARLLRPVRDAAERSAFVDERVKSGEIYHPTRWSAAEAYAFLAEVPALEDAGLVVRVPDWWRTRRSRVGVTARVGDEPPTGELGLAALMDFDVALALDGEPLTDEERRALLSGEAGLRMLRGQWVEVDPERLAALLDHFASVERAAAAGTLTFAEGMRLLAGMSGPDDAGDDTDERAPWADVVAGDWLRERLAELTDARARDDADPGEALRAELRPYQRDGVAWLWALSRLGLGGCLADDMGLGKTMQVLALLLLLKRREGGRHLLVLPASLIGNWEAEAARFAPDLRLAVAHRSRGDAAKIEADAEGADVVLTTYGTLTRTEWLKAADWDLVVLDEAQAIKNPRTRQSRAVKALSSRLRVALTGTPVENRLGDLWSLFDFLAPGLLGSAQEFTRATRAMAKAGGYAPLRRVIRPYVLRRLKTDPAIAPELPDKTEVVAWCTLTKAQAALYERTVKSLAREVAERDGMERRGLVLSYLQRFKQICNHPAQHRGDGEWAHNGSGKLLRLRALCEPIAARQERVLVFTQFREATGPLARFLGEVFGREGLVLHGGTPVGKRAELVERFAERDGPPFFVISLKAGGTGLNLTAAQHVVHFDRWWNPAVENQATDRAYRIGQRRNVLVHKFVCRGTLEERIDEMIRSKQKLADEVLEAGATPALTELDDDALLELVHLDLARAIDG